MNKMFKYILLVDDDQATNFIHKRLLEKIDCSEKIISFNNGREAFGFISDSLSLESKQVLVLLDINMPVMDGWEFLEAYTSLPEDTISGITIAMVTSSPDPNDKAMAQAKNIDHYLNKPLNKSDIMKLVESIFQH